MEAFQRLWKGNIDRKKHIVAPSVPSVHFITSGFKTCEMRKNLVSNPFTVVPVMQVNMQQMLFEVLGYVILRYKLSV